MGVDVFNSKDRLRTQNDPIPIIGLDGGVLIHSQLVDSIGYEGLQTYLKARTSPTGALYAVTAGDEGAIVHKAPQGTYLTSRGYPYYGANIRFNNEPRDVRKELFLQNLGQNASLAQEWEETLGALSYLNPSDQYRIGLALLQNLNTDVIGAEYGISIAEAFSKFPHDLAFWTNISHEIGTAYYRLLREGEGIPHMPEEVREALQVLPQEYAGITAAIPQHIDEVRTRREADLYPHVTLAAAEQFHAEFGSEAPTVVLPRLGSFDLGPALRAIGYEGTICHVTTSIKQGALHDSGETAPRQESRVIHLNGQLDTAGIPYDEGVVIFDDSITSGKTMKGICDDIKDGGREVSAVRTLFHDPSSPEGQEVLSELREAGITGESYYKLPLAMKTFARTHSDGYQQFLTPRAVSERWFKLAQH